MKLCYDDVKIIIVDRAIKNYKYSNNNRPDSELLAVDTATHGTLTESSLI